MVIFREVYVLCGDMFQCCIVEALIGFSHSLSYSFCGALGAHGWCGDDGFATTLAVYEYFADLTAKS